MPVKILSASAGSGKTYNLAMFYVRLAMEKVDNYEKILAITFTNAAVNEMKNRILNYLFELSKGNGINDYRTYAAVNQNEDDKHIIQKASEVLNRIVHHYYNFSVSTIDSFLQRLFKGALYEIGIRTNYELIVNNEEVIEQAVNDFLLNLDEHQTAFKWLVKFIKNNAKDNKSFSYSKQLIELTKEINKEFFYPFEKDFASLTEEDFDQLEEILKKRINDFIEKAKTFNKRFSELCEKTDLTENDFYHASSGPASFLGSKLLKFINEKSSIGSAFKLDNKYLNEALDEGKWVSKNIEQKFNPYRDEFQQLLTEFIESLKTDGKQYEDARVILEQLFNISILNQIVKNLHEYKKTNNVVLLSDIGKMLQGFISNNYLFVYEKLGVRYEYFLIDEFQDTSNIQYQVIKPLIENSISEKVSESVLLVGDIKQAIYRWRNGDWKLMNKTIHEDFSNNVNVSALEYNWRSYPVVIDFNNAILKQLVQFNDLYKDSGIDNSALLTLAQDIYKDVEQIFPNTKKLDDVKGYVKLFVNKKKNNEDAEQQDDNGNDNLVWVVNEVSCLWKAGYKNIGIIVRKNKEASTIFDFLMNNLSIDDDDFKVISKESITYINSNAVMWVVFTLHYVQNASSYAHYMANAFYDKLQLPVDVEEFYSSLLGNAAFKAKNLYFKAEFLINSFFSNFNEREKTFSIHFLQLLKKYLENNTSGEAKFIQWFFEKGIDESIKISGEKKGVHLVTIHKSKGLEYDAVIVPYVNWTKKAAVNYLWLNKTDWVKESNIPAFLVKSNKNLLASNFDKQYLLEQNNEKLDDINLLYVAFTRAKKVLIAGIEQQLIGKELSKLIETNFKIENVNKNIDSYKTFENENVTIFEFGELKGNDEPYAEIESEHYEIKPNSKPQSLRLVVKGNEEWSSQKSIAHGVLIHAIMEQITDIINWEQVAQRVMITFNVAEPDKKQIKENIKNILARHNQIKDWFTIAEKIISERKILHQGRIYRPDKVFLHNDKVILVDFKTGETNLEAYKAQVIRYKSMLMALNYDKIEAYLLNIDTNELVLVD